MNKQAAVIEINNLTKQYNGRKAVDQLNLQIKTGTIFGLLGANGSGKTTALKLLCGLLYPDEGEGQCLGLDLRQQIKQIQSQIGYMPQQFCLYQHLSVYENLDFIGRLYGLANRQQRLTELLELLNLSDIQGQIAGTLSGGWQKRLALAAALLHKPRILILDEPTSGLDPQSRLMIWDYIQSLTQQNVTVLLSTHYMDEAERCHQLAYLAHGQLIIQGSSAEIIRQTGLSTWTIHSDAVNPLKELLLSHRPDLQLIEKGQELRVSSRQADLWSTVDIGGGHHYVIISVPTSLEDALIFQIKQEGRPS